MRKQKQCAAGDGGAVPTPVIRRLARYLVHVQSQRESGTRWMTSGDIATELGLTSSTVRQDLIHTEFYGKARVGYDADLLEDVLKKRLGIHSVTNIAIVGAGNMGKALAMHKAFKRYGFSVVAVFDNSPEVIGHKIGPLTVHPMSRLKEIVKTRRIDLALLVVHESAAESAAGMLVKAGVKGLLNLTPRRISTPENVQVLDVQIASCLMELQFMVNTRRRTVVKISPGRIPGL